MKKYEHITKMENIMDKHEEILDKVDFLIKELKDRHEDYEELIKYYYSDQRNLDLEDDSKGKIPKDLSRGVLTEDLIYNLIKI